MLKKKQLFAIIAVMLAVASSLAIIVSDNSDASVGGTFYSSDNTLKYTIKTEDTSTKTGTVYVSAISAGILNIPANVVCEEITYIVIIQDSAFIGKGITSVTIGEGIASIGASAFQSCRYLTSISIPNSVTSIGASAFQSCSSLTSISIPNSVTSIGASAFQSCSSLTSINVPNEITSIGASAFQFCSALTSINISNSVTSIGNYAFYSCSALTSINISNNDTSIGNYAFQYCSALTSINILDGVTSIGSYSFQYCSALTSINILDGVTSIGSYSFQYCSALTSITIPNSVTSIGNYAFGNCYALTSVTIPSSVENIGNNAFSSCKALTDLKISLGVKNIGDSAFSSCTGLITVVLPNSVNTIGNGSFYNCKELKEISIPGVEALGSNAFGSCKKLTTIEIPSTVTLINSDTFNTCSSLKSISIPNSVTSIGANAFSYCFSLTSIIIPSSVTSIGASAFQSCSSLTSIIIPSSVTSIGEYALYGCTGLRSITFDGQPSTLSNYSFSLGTSYNVTCTVWSKSWADSSVFTPAIIGNYTTLIYPEYTVTGTIDNGGSTSEIGQTVKYWLNSAEMTFTACPGYHIISYSIIDSSGITTNPVSGESTLQYTYPAQTNVSSNMTVTVYTAGDTHTVSYNYNTGSGIIADETATYNNSYTTNDGSNFSKTEHHLSGWNTSIDGTGNNYGLSYTFTYSMMSSLTLYAVWDIDSYSVTYTSSDLTVMNSGIEVVSSTPVNYGTILTLATKDHTGYTIVNITASVGTISANSYTMGAAAVTFTVEYKINTYAVTFHYGSETDTQSFIYGQPSVLISTSFTKVGYTLSGWSTTNGGAQIYSTSKTVSNLADNGNIDLYAVWTPNYYTVSFNGNDETSGIMESEILTYDSIVALTHNSYSKTGYVFIGWDTNPAGTTVVYANEETLTNAQIQALGSSFTLYAVWQQITISGNSDIGYNIILWAVAIIAILMLLILLFYIYLSLAKGRYNVIFDDNGGEGYMKDQKFMINLEGYLIVNSFNKPGYVFMGWSKTPDGPVEYLDGQSVSNLESSKGKNVTLYAVWNIK